MTLALSRLTFATARSENRTKPAGDLLKPPGQGFQAKHHDRAWLERNFSTLDARGGWNCTWLAVQFFDYTPIESWTGLSLCRQSGGHLVIHKVRAPVMLTHRFCAMAAAHWPHHLNRSAR